MLKKYLIRKNHYCDSVLLMKVAADLETLPGILQATAIMATAANLELARTVDLIDDTIEAQPNNLLLAVIAEDEGAATKALSQAEENIEKAGSNTVAARNLRLEAKSIEMSVSQDTELNWALISCPGEYAAAEAKKALNLGLNVMLFSDNVSIQEEVEIKKIGRAADLLVMGPDCGTAIINGLPLGFANVVTKGPVGIAAASGTGLQQVSSLLTQWGVGISQAIGTGGRDLSADVGGVAMTEAIKVLGEDAQTEMIILVSKPANKEVAEKIFAVAREAEKPVIVCFFTTEKISSDGLIQFVTTLDEAAEIAYSIVNSGDLPKRITFGTEVTSQSSNQKDTQKYLRGVYSGGTFCYETQFILNEVLGRVWSSTALDPAQSLKDPFLSQEHTVIDLGDDVFTQGRPHPMIDHRLRHERILQEASDPETAVILFDVVIGFGSHADPASEMLRSIQEAREIAAKGGRQIYFVGFVCGTDMDPQNLKLQIETLQSAGAILADSNAMAARQAASLIIASSK